MDINTCNTGFPKVCRVAPLGAITGIQGATRSKGARGGPRAVKERQEGHDVIILN